MAKVLSLEEYQKSKEAELFAMARFLPDGFFDGATDDAVKRQTKDLSKYNTRRSFGNLLSGNIGNDKCLLEGITRSFPLAAVKKHIEKHYKPSVKYKALPEHVKELLGSTIWTLRIFEAPVNAYNSVVSYYDLEEWQFAIQDNSDGTQTHAMVVLPDILDNVLLMDETMACFGYYNSCKLPVSKVFPKIKNMNNWCVLQYEQRVQGFVNEKIREEEYLYHIPPTNVEKKILKIGIVPKSKNAVFNYPDRVYLLKGSEKDVSYGLGGVANLLFQNSGNNAKGEYTVYRICVSKLPSNINFQLDYNFQPASVFTADNIPPYAIQVFARIEIKN